MHTYVVIKSRRLDIWIYFLSIAKGYVCFMLNVQTYYCNTMLKRVLTNICVFVCLTHIHTQIVAVVVVVSAACWNIQTKMLWKYELMLIDCKIWSSWGLLLYARHECNTRHTDRRTHIHTLLHTFAWRLICWYNQSPNQNGGCNIFVNAANRHVCVCVSVIVCVLVSVFISCSFVCLRGNQTSPKRAQTQTRIRTQTQSAISNAIAIPLPIPGPTSWPEAIAAKFLW